MHPGDRAGWLQADELRVGLGCMRLSTDEDRDEELAVATVTAALSTGVTVFDTARSYGHGPDDLGHNERLIAHALSRYGSDASPRIVTKGGMTRVGGGWIADGRARTIRADCEASLGALDGLGIDVYLVHAPDPRTPWRTTVRALSRLVDDGLVSRVGVSNVNRAQLDEALELAPVGVVEVAISPFDDRALRGGVLDRCADAGVTVIAHSPLGGPRRAPTLARREPLAAIAETHGTTAAVVALAWLLGLSTDLVVIPGARRPDSVASAVTAVALELPADERELLDRALGRPRAKAGGRRRSAGRQDGTDVVVVMGIPGAGKTRFAESFLEQGYERLNRDERGGSLRAVAAALDDTLAGGTRRVVLDNTYLTRASRSHVLEAAARHGIRVRCVWLDTPLAQAQVNLVERLLDRHETLPEPDELRRLARTEQGVLAPTSQMRALRELEPPSEDEGFTLVEHVEFARAQSPATARGVFVAASVLRAPGWKRAVAAADPRAPHLVFDWIPARDADEFEDLEKRLAAAVRGTVERALCPHPGGPPTCWCRPPLPGLCLGFARRHDVDPESSSLLGTSPAHRTLANALGARYVSV